MFPLMSEVNCPYCGTHHQVKLRGIEPHLNSCTKCKKLFVVDLTKQIQSGLISIQIEVLRVERRAAEKKARKEKDDLKIVA